MRKNKLFTLVFTLSLIFISSNAHAKLEDYTTLRDIDKGTFNEYRYYMVREYFKLKEQFELNGTIDKKIVLDLLKYAKSGYNYLPDNLMNQNFYNDLSIAIKKGYETPNSEVNYEEIIKKLNNYLEKTNISAVSGTIEATPNTGNAPLTVTFRGKVTDPTGTIIPPNNYVWWVDSAGTKKVIGKGKSITYTFKEEGNFSVFLDVKSNHKNSAGYNDVIPFSSRSIVEVKEKVASIIININSKSLGESDEIKFTPEEASYGLIFDATSSTPTGGAKFIKTEWDFGNGVEKKYDNDPKIERVIYSREGDYTVKLKLQTNEGKTVERKFVVIVRKPIATIQSNIESGYIGDKFVFSAKSSINEKNLSFLWNIIDIGNDKIISTKDGNIINHIFNEKGRYNIQLKVKDSAGNEDTDTKIIYINSRPPIAEFTYSIPDNSKPNRVLLDGSKSLDPDFSDDGKLKYIWTINGQIVELDQLDNKGAVGYYTFDSVGSQSVSLEVVDPDQMSGIKQMKIPINSTLSVELFSFPRVIQRGSFIRFVASSPNARTFEWDFGDGDKKSGTSNKIEHVYNKSGTYNVKLVVRDADGNLNEVSKIVYVRDSNSPLAVIGVDFGLNEAPEFDKNACDKGAYVVDRVKVVNFRGGESINVDGQTTGLSYSWKIGNKLISNMDATYKFDELGCFPIKLTVKSLKTGAIDTTETWIKVVNIKPSLTSLDIQVQDDKKDPVVVSVSALGAKDPDGVIQSYLWYYYTDSDIEPQDFRITTVPNTTFVLPKIAGNYYFVVVMKDNNDERSSSEELSSSKYSITLSGDNVNTPLIDFKVNKSSVLIGEEVVFTVTAKNILGQDITSKSQFAWDFDGDGFYDKETNTGDITHKFQNSGTFYSKVRVKYKGMTNVRTVEMNVANILEPKFDYISLGDTYLFFNTSVGKFDKVIWDLGDGNTITDKNYFSYTYEDGKKVHDVSIKIMEGTKVKSKTSQVVSNIKNMLSLRNAKGLKIFSYPEEKNGKIILKDSSEKVYLNINQIENVKNYAVDFDIYVDSDLNGGKDDDMDNKNDPSFNNAGLLEVSLNDKKTQKVRVFLLDLNGEVIDSKDIEIEKDYIKDEEVDLGKVVFNGITEDEKVKIEKLKVYLKELPQEHRLKAMKYLQRLQEEWFYVNEKTKVILEFESFIDSLGVSNSTDIINLLESFLIQGQEDQSVRNMAYNVIKNLIPKELVEYKEIIANLDQIKSNPDKIEENKVLGREILEMIKDTSLIKNEDKLTIKSQLQVFIYGSVDKIPQEVVKEVKQEKTPSDKIVGLFVGVIKVIGIVFGVIIVGFLGFFIRYKISNKNENLGFQDFIIEKTSGKGSSSNNDVLSNVQPVNKEQTKKEEKKEESLVTRDIKKTETKSQEQVDILSNATNNVNKSETKPKEEVRIQEQNLAVNSEVETKVEEEKIPDWLKGALGGTQTGEQSQTQEEPKEEVRIQEQNLAVNTEVETKVEEEKIPDWLKGALGGTQTGEQSQTQEEPKEEVQIQEQNLAVNSEVETKVEEEKIPDWLKGALDTNKLTKEELKEDAVIDYEPKKSKKKNVKEKKEPTETRDIEADRKTKKVNSSKKAEEKKEELWDNGMDVPDWLKTSDDNTSANNSKDDFWTLNTDGSSSSK